MHSTRATRIRRKWRRYLKRYNYAINDPELIRRYRMVEDGKRDVATRIAVAEEKAEARKNRENARAMRNAGIDVALIAQITGLDEAEINAL